MKTIEAAQALTAAIRTFTQDGPDGGPNGPTEEAYAEMLDAHIAVLDAVLPLLDKSTHGAAIAALQSEGMAIAKYGEHMIVDIRALRVAADAYFDGDFRKGPRG